MYNLEQNENLYKVETYQYVSEKECFADILIFYDGEEYTFEIQFNTRKLFIPEEYSTFKSTDEYKFQQMQIFDSDIAYQTSFTNKNNCLQHALHWTKELIHRSKYVDPDRPYRE